MRFRGTCSQLILMVSLAFPANGQKKDTEIKFAVGDELVHFYELFMHRLVDVNDICCACVS